eukprot:TRINITY_DN70_c0_g1_i1.p2 TRINITY_DN70_c0_g1~~TRINITY_DN70_c0_g1_i1.p2  ORF type:complete len:148 (-),score=82.01 TRINITY_DN70_c0_g1_i1:104-493(-)
MKKVLAITLLALAAGSAIATEVEAEVDAVAELDQDNSIEAFDAAYDEEFGQEFVELEDGEYLDETEFAELEVEGCDKAALLADMESAKAYANQLYPGDANKAARDAYLNSEAVGMAIISRHPGCEKVLV